MDFRVIPVIYGIREDCPLSSLVCVVGAEPLAIRICNTNIYGFQLLYNAGEVKQCGDDKSLCLKNNDKIHADAFTEDLFRFSGLTLNVQEMKLVKMGMLEDDDEFLKDFRW